MRSSTPRASAISRSCRRRFVRHRAERHRLEAGVVRVAIEPREPFELVGHLDEAGDVAGDHLDGLRVLRRRQAGQAQQRHGGGNRRQRLAPFVRRHAGELPQPFRLLGDGLGVEPDKGLDGLLQQHRRPRDAASRPRRCTRDGRRRQHQADRFVLDEAQQDAAEQLVLAQHLVQGGALLMAQRARARGLCSTTRVLAAIASSSGALQVGADVDDQRRNVIEQAVAREHFVGADRQQVAQAARTSAPASSACSAAMRSAIASEYPVVIMEASTACQTLEADAT